MEDYDNKLERKRARERETDKSLATYGLYKFDQNDPETYILARDAVFGVAAMKNTAMVQHIIDCIFGKGRFEVIRHNAQSRDQGAFGGKAVALDVLAQDKGGRRFDLEIQIAREKDLLKRAREYRAHIDAAQLRSGEEAGDLKDTYVIFITAYDPFKIGRSLYRVETYVEGLPDPVDDGSHILFVNALNPEGGTPLGELCEDLFCQDEGKIHSTVMLDALKYCRSPEGKEGVIMRMNQTDHELRQKLTEEIRAQVTDEVREETAKEVREEDHEIFVRNHLRRGGFTDEDIAELAGIPLEEVIRIREKIESEGK